MSTQNCRYSELLGWFDAYVEFQEPDLDEFIGKLCEKYDPEMGYAWLKKIMYLISDNEVTIEKNDGTYPKVFTRKYLKMNYNGMSYAICMDDEVVWDVELGVAEYDESDLFAALIAEANEDDDDSESDDDEPEPEPVVQRQDIVKKFEYQGKKYLREFVGSNRRVFDYTEYVKEGEKVLVGTWDDALNQIIFN